MGAENGRSGLQLRHCVLEIIQRPAVVAADDLSQTGRRDDGEGCGQLVEPAVRFGGVQNIGHEVFTLDVLVRVDVLPEIFQQALCRVLLHRQAGGNEQIRHIPGEKLRVQLCDAVAGLTGDHGISGHGVVGVVLDDDAVLVAFAVEFDDPAPKIPVEIHAGQRQLGFLREACGVHAIQQDGLNAGCTVGEIIGNGTDAAIGEDGGILDGAVVDVAFQPVENLLRYAGGGVPAVDRIVAFVIQIVFSGAGQDGAHVRREQVAVAEGESGRIDRAEAERAGTGVPERTDRAILIVVEICAAIRAVHASEIAAVGAVNIDVLPIGEIDVSGAVRLHSGEEGIRRDRAAVKQKLRFQRAVRRKVQQPVAVAAAALGNDGAVRSGIAAGALQRPEAAVRRGAERGDHDVVRCFLRCICGRGVGRDGIPFLRVEVEAVKPRLRLIGGVPVRIDGVAAQKGGGQNQRIARQTAGVHAACVGGQINVCGYISVFCARRGCICLRIGGRRLNRG